MRDGSRSDLLHRVGQLEAQVERICKTLGLARPGRVGMEHEEPSGSTGTQDQLRALARASIRIAAAPTLEAVLQETTDQAREIIGAHLAATHLVRDLDWAKASVVVSLSDKYAPFRSFDAAPTGAGIYAEALRGSVPLRLGTQELQTHPGWRGFSRYAGDHPPLSGLLAAPLSGRDQGNIGVVMVSDRVEGTFTAEDEAILMQLAQLASVIIEKAGAEQALRNSEQHLRATYEHASVGIIEADARGRILKVNEAFCAITGYARGELRARTFLDLTHPDDVGPDQASYERQIAGEIGTYQLEKRYVRRGGEIAWVSVSSAAVRDEADRFQYAVRVVQDITKRKQAEERQRLLMSELDHRVRNTLARVQSIAAQTLRSARSPEAFYEAFEVRLRALSQAHSLLNEAGWTGAVLRSVLEGELAPYRDGTGARWSLEGPDVTLLPRATLSLGMVFHELATNAAKYGALSAPGGRVEVSWRVAGEGDDEASLQLEWRERGGPEVTRPQRTGFGSRLIRVGVAHELGGEVELDFEPAGLRCAISAPLSSVAAPTAGKPPGPGEDSGW